MSEPRIPLPPPVPQDFRPIEVIVVRPQRPRYWLHALLLLLTFVTTSIVGAQLQYNFDHGLPVFRGGDGFLPLFPVEWLLRKPALLLQGLPFSLTLMLILLAHEMGHYLYARRYRISATLPYFIPAPTLIGTLGAFIRIKSRIWSREALFDIGIAGPIAGFVVALPVMIAGLLLSRPLPALDKYDIVLGFPLIFDLARHLLGLFSTLLRTSPLSGLNMHPVAIAAWVGMLATSLNLIPGGQLDGGHIVYAVSPRAHKAASIFSILVLLPLAIFSWVGWLIWAVMLAATGVRHPDVPRQPALSPGRRLLAYFALLMLLLTLTPAPFHTGSGLDALRESNIHIPFVSK